MSTERQPPPHFLPGSKECRESLSSFLYFEGVPNYFWLSWQQMSREQVKRPTQNHQGRGEQELLRQLISPGNSSAITTSVLNIYTLDKAGCSQKLPQPSLLRVRGKRGGRQSHDPPNSCLTNKGVTQNNCWDLTVFGQGHRAGETSPSSSQICRVRASNALFGRCFPKPQITVLWRWLKSYRDFVDRREGIFKTNSPATTVKLFNTSKLSAFHRLKGALRAKAPPAIMWINN